MAPLGIAFRVFWRTLTNDAFARSIEPLLAGAPPAPPVIATKPTPPTPEPRPPARSEALTLLALLQREARLVDFLKEPIMGYSDAQVGAAVRDIHRDAATALDRLFALKPLLDVPENSPVEVPAGFDAARYRLTGNVAGQAPFKGALRHPGWEATKVNLPAWNGSPDSAKIVAPAEVEI